MDGKVMDMESLGVFFEVVLGYVLISFILLSLRRNLYLFDWFWLIGFERGIKWLI